VVQNLFLLVFFHDLACILNLFTVLDASFTYNDLPLIRYTAESLNLLILEILTNIQRVLNEEKKMVEIAIYFVSICYAPWFLKSKLSQKVSANDLAAFKKLYHK
jgi:hypothetical protein